MGILTPTAATAATTSVSIPTHAVGDMIVIVTDRATATAPSVPAAGGTVPTWLLIYTSSHDTDSVQAYYAIATATNHTSGTWTNAVNTTAVVVKPSAGTVALGAHPAAGTQGITGTLIRYPALTRSVTDGTSAIIRVGHRRAAAAGVATVPTANYTNVQNAPATPVTSVFYYLAASANPVQDDVTGLSAGATTGATFEVTFTAAANVDDTVTGVRALASAAGRAGTPKVSLLGVRGAATAAGKVGTPRVYVTGTRALATAAGKPGTPKVVLAGGVRALATAAGVVGSPKVSILGVRATATAAGKIGAVRKDCNGPGARATATAAGRAGTPRVSVTGTRALSTAAGKPGTPKVTVTGARAAATAAGRSGTPAVWVTGTRATATAAGKPGTPKVAVTGVRALATAAGKVGSVSTGAGNKTVIGVRAEARAYETTITATQDETVTMTTNLSLGDGFLLANGDLFGLSSNSPAKLATWRNPGTDLATFTTTTFPNDGTYNAPIGMRATAAGDFLYIAFRGYDDGSNWKVRIIKLDTSDLSYTTLVTDDWGDSSLVGQPGAGDLCLDSTHLYFLNHGDISIGDAEVRKYLLASGAVVDTQLISGRRRGHPIQLDPDTGLLFFAGTDFANGWYGWMDPADLSSYDTANIAASITVEDDFVMRGDYLFFAAETSNPVKIYRVRKDLTGTPDALVSSVTGTAHGMALHSDGVTLLIGARDANKIVAWNADTLTEGASFSVTSALAKVNDLVLDAPLLYVSTFETTAKVARLTLTQTRGGRPGTPKVTVTGVRALASAAGKPGSVTTTAAGTAVVGVRATATAAGRAGTPKIAVTGQRAAATAAGTTGSPRVSILGVRALATAAGVAGTPKVAVTGARALATAAGRAGAAAVVGSRVVTGIRATATAAGRPGTPKVAVTGARAAATAAGVAGTPRVAVTGVRALATAAGKPGAASAPGNKAVTGVRALATAAGSVGSPKVSILGVRAASSAAGRAGTPKVQVTGVRALATATGKAGTVAKVSSPAIAGTRALATAAGRAGTPKIALTGTRAAATATGRAGSPAVLILGRRAVASAGCTPGTIHTAHSVVVAGVRGLAVARANPGTVGVPSAPVLTPRTTIDAAAASTILATDDGRTLVSTGSNRTRVSGSGRGGRVRLTGSRSSTE